MNKRIYRETVIYVLLGCNIYWEIYSHSCKCVSRSFGESNVYLTECCPSVADHQLHADIGEKLNVLNRSVTCEVGG
jgi:hypothetical protein